MSNLSPKERLLRALNRQPADRPPVICPGGMMNAAIVDVMQKSGYTLPEAHNDAGLMAALAAAVHEYTGFENLGIPFCMTAEAEVLGSAVDYGTLQCEPKIIQEAFSSVATVQFRDLLQISHRGRLDVIAGAAHILTQKYPDIPVIGNLTGPISAAASIVDPIPFLKELRKNPAEAHRVLEYVTNFLIEFTGKLIDSGVTLISIADPTATGEILGPKMFNEYAVKYLNQLLDAIHSHSTASGRPTPAILHICGNMTAVKHLIAELHANAISTDAIVSLKQLKDEIPGLVAMGNVSTYLLEFGPVEKVRAQTGKLVADGIDIIAPACGLSTSTTLEHIQVMTATVIKDNNRCNA